VHDGTHFCKNGCGPLCVAAAEATNCPNGICHDVMSLAVAFDTGMAKREDWEVEG
jgi:hypothetical protein